MASSGKWTVVFEDKMIIKKSGDASGTFYVIEDDDFWNQSKFSNIWAIQYGTFAPSDTIEHRDQTPHCTWEEANLGDFQDFISRWDTAHLSQLQSNWDNDNVDGESESDKIARLGERPTSYSS